MADDKFTRRGRLGRMVKLGQTAASVTGSMVTRSIASRFRRDPEAAMKAGRAGDAQKVARTMGELKGLAMKFGQLLSVAPGQIPEEIQRELAVLHRDAPPMPYELVAEQFERGTGLPIREAFRSFEPDAIGTASIGQVHKARTLDGRDVAVKVQYPDILETLEADLRNLQMLTSVGRLITDKEMIEKTLAELRGALTDEADYAQEADNLKAAGALFTERDDVRVPAVVDELSSATVLTMEFVEGEKLDEALAKLDPAEKNHVGMQFGLLFMWMFHEKQVLHADPHPGNFLLTPDRRIGLLDFGCFRRYRPEFTDGWLKVAAAKWRGDVAALRPLFDELGFRARRGSAGLSSAQLDELLDITSAPFLEDRDFDWGRWAFRPALQRFTARNLAVVQYTSPPEAIFYFRSAAGVSGLLQRHGIVGNLYRPARALVEKRGLLTL